MATIGIREALSLVAVTLLPAGLLGGLGAINARGSEGAWVFMLTLKVTAAFAVAIGLPAIYLLGRFGLQKLRHYLIVGVVVSMALAAIFIYPGLSHDRELLGLSSYLLQYGVLLLLSLLVTALYWLLARPDRRGSKEPGARQDS